MWKQTDPKPQPVKQQLDFGPITLTVTAEGKCWQWGMMSLGRYSEQSLNECLKTWPREAIRLARAELDKFEASLEEEREAGIQERTADSRATQAGSGAA